MSIEDKSDDQLIGTLMGYHESIHVQLNAAQTAIDAARQGVNASVPVMTELTKRLFEQRELNKASVPAEPKPPTVPPVALPDLDHNGILDSVMSAVPTEEGLILAILPVQKMPMFGEPDFLSEWTLRDGTHYANKHWDGLGNKPDNTNAFLRVPGSGGSYGYIDDLSLDRCLIENACRWGMRAHGVRSGFRVTKTLIRNVRKEHGAYLSVCGGGSGPAVFMEDTVFNNIASQAVQVVQRDKFWPGDYSHETPNPEADFTPGGPLLFNRIAVIDGAKEAGDRESFDFSFFRSRNHIGMVNILIDDRAQDVSRGFLMAQGYHGLDDPFIRVASCTHFVWRSGASEQEAASFQEMGGVELVDGVIDVPEGQGAVLRFKGCSEKVYIKNVTSLRAKVRVEIDGVDAGFVDGWDGYR